MFLLLLSVIYFVWQNKNADHFNIKVNPPITESVGRMAITANGILKLKISQNTKWADKNYPKQLLYPVEPLILG